MRSFNPISVWTQTAIGTKTVKAVKSIQHGTITFTNGGADNPTATITSVDYANNKAALAHLGGTVGIKSTGATSVATEFCRLTLTDATTVTGTRSSDFNGQDATVAFCVTEYY